MAVDTAWLKSHWYYIAGGIVALIVLYELIQAAGGSGSSSPSVGGTSDQLQALSAAADLQNAQTNAAITTASYSADVANNQTAAALQLGEVQTAAELAATNNQTSASEAVSLASIQGAEEIQNTVTAGQVQETQIEGDTLQGLAKTAASVPLAQIAATNTQILNLEAYSKHFNEDIQAIAPVIAEETGQGSSAGAVKASPQSTGTAGNPITQGVAKAIPGGINTILSGLFA